MRKIPFKDLSEERKMEIVSDHMGDSWYEEVEADFVGKLREFGFEEAEIAFSGFWSQGDGASFTCNRIDVSLFLEKCWDQMDFQHEALDRWEEFKESGAGALMQLGFEPEELDETKPMTLRILERELDPAEPFYGRVKRSSRYVHENSTDLYLDLENYYVVDMGESDPADLRFEVHEEEEILALYRYLENWMEGWMRDQNRELYRKLEKEYYAWQEELLRQLEDENEEWAEFGMSAY
jgi:hypothetical protein